ncbi:hypothetical protein F4824DRAFT_221363 [Ustulina deusta]|nr:hypothetical protein F4823DRAFT_489852 [Ustulina deusta]KAI3334003.1 hypothetical protein F4824DRAFT_221363 [Ustulina deusta]
MTMVGNAGGRFPQSKRLRAGCAKVYVYVNVLEGLESSTWGHVESHTSGGKRRRQRRLLAANESERDTGEGTKTSHTHPTRGYRQLTETGREEETSSTPERRDRLMNSVAAPSLRWLGLGVLGVVAAVARFRRPKLVWAETGLVDGARLYHWYDRQWLVADGYAIGFEVASDDICAGRCWDWVDGICCSITGGRDGLPGRHVCRQVGMLVGGLVGRLVGILVRRYLG